MTTVSPLAAAHPTASHGAARRLPRTAPPAAALLALALGACTASGATPQEKRYAVDDMAVETLDRLYQERPMAREEVRTSAGYAVFSNKEVSVLVVGGGGGYGVAVDNDTGERTYMKMAKGTLGPGLGAKDFRAVFVFHDGAAFETFVDEGWDFGGEADAAAKVGSSGGAVGAAATTRDDVTVYQVTESGLALQANVAGTRYWPYATLE